MPKFKYILVGIFSFFVINLSSQERDVLAWNTPLTWNDFQGKPNRLDSSHALTNMGISVEYSWTNLRQQIRLEYKVQSVFNKLYSWVKPGRKSEDLLLHEQTHFDITELHARKIRKYLKENQFKKGKVRLQIDEKLNELQLKNQRLQEQYDHETNHGAHKKKQLQWSRKIKRELQQYEAYKNIRN